MSSQIQELIDKIKNDGIESAKVQAKEIEDQAHTRAKEIIAEAERASESMISQAKDEANKLQVSAQKSLHQVSRDMLLSLRQGIEHTLQRLVSSEVNHTLSSEHLAKIISTVISKNVDAASENKGIEIVLSHKDLKELGDGFITKLKQQVKQGVKLQSSDDIGGGFTISYDDGKSSFDFTDESLAQYLSSYLNDQLGTILKGAV